jgi:hypothetical protein
MFEVLASQLEDAFVPGSCDCDRLPDLLEQVERQLGRHARDLTRGGLIDQTSPRDTALLRRFNGLRLQAAVLHQTLVWGGNGCDDLEAEIDNLAAGLRRLAEDEAGLVVEATQSDLGAGD